MCCIVIFKDIFLQNKLNCRHFHLSTPDIPTLPIFRRDSSDVWCVLPVSRFLPKYLDFWCSSKIEVQVFKQKLIRVINMEMGQQVSVFFSPKSNVLRSWLSLTFSVVVFPSLPKAAHYPVQLYSQRDCDWHRRLLFISENHAHLVFWKPEVNRKQWLSKGFVVLVLVVVGARMGMVGKTVVKISLFLNSRGWNVC